MNKFAKFLINISFIISILFIGLILAEYLFNFSIIFPTLLIPIIFISISVALTILLIFCFYILNTNVRELYFKGHVGFYDVVQNISAKNNFQQQVEFDTIKDLFQNGQITFEQLKELNENGIFSLLYKDISELFINKHLSVEQINQIDNLKRKTLDRTIRNDNIRSLFKQGIMTFEQLKELKSDGISALEIDFIKDFFINKKISINQLNELNHLARFALKIDNIRDLFINNRLSFVQLIQIDHDAKNALEIDNIRDLFVNEEISIEQLKELDHHARFALEAEHIRDLFINKKISIDQLKELNVHARKTLEIENIKDLFVNEEISIDQLNELDVHARFALEIDNIKDLFVNEEISIEQLNQLNNDAKFALKAENIRDLFTENRLTVEQLLQINHNAREALEIDFVKDLFINNRLTFEQVFQINYNNLQSFKVDIITDLITENQLSVEQLLQINHNAREALKIDFIKDFFAEDRLSFEQLFQINHDAREALKIEYIRDFFINNQISFAQLLQLDNNARQALKRFNIRGLFNENILTFEQILQFTDLNRNALNNENIISMFINGHLNFDQILQCDAEVQNALIDTNNCNQLILNQITWAEFYENVHRRVVRDLVHLNRNAERPQIINRNQSTHTASVHQSVSDSAIALKNRYGHNVSKNEVTNQINQLRSAINDFTPNQTITTHIHEAAKRGLDRLANLDIDFEDPKSNLSIVKLIALTYIAAIDDDYRQHSYNDYLEAIILAFYEIQRGYNLNDNAIDNTKVTDRPICIGGTFNKIIEKMVGILPDCSILFITFEIITFKANELVKNIVSQFLSDRTSLELPNESELTSIETNQRGLYIEHLKDITNSKSNHEENPLFKALNAKLLQHIKSNLDNEFSPHHEKHFNEYFTIEMLIDTIFTSKSIQTFINNEIERYIEGHQTDTNLTQNALFQSSEPTSSERDHALTQNNQNRN